LSRNSSLPAVGESSRPQTQVCTSLSASTCERMARDAETAFNQGTDLVEFRLDMLREPKASNISKEFSEHAHRAVFTVRPPSEGGSFRGNESQRLDLMQKVSEMRPAFIDVELRTFDDNPDLELADPTQSMIVSWHDTKRTPTPKRLRSILSRARTRGGIPKLVAAAIRPSDNLSMLSLYDTPGVAPIAFCMGPEGLFSRAMAIHHGSPLAYAALPGKQTAPGQLPLSSALALRRGVQHVW
jgi:3-dehydroquinate dehydratase I